MTRNRGQTAKESYRDYVETGLVETDAEMNNWCGNRRLGFGSSGLSAGA